MQVILKKQVSTTSFHDIKMSSLTLNSGSIDVTSISNSFDKKEDSQVSLSKSSRSDLHKISDNIVSESNAIYLELLKEGNVTYNSAQQKYLDHKGREVIIKISAERFNSEQSWHLSDMVAKVLRDEEKIMRRLGYSNLSQNLLFVTEARIAMNFSLEEIKVLTERPLYLLYDNKKQFICAINDWLGYSKISNNKKFLIQSSELLGQGLNHDLKQGQKLGYSLDLDRKNTRTIGLSKSLEKDNKVITTNEDIFHLDDIDKKQNAYDITHLSRDKASQYKKEKRILNNNKNSKKENKGCILF